METHMQDRVVWFNGEFVPEREARLSIYDSSLMFGDMVFEMTRSFGGRQFKLREHLERLMAGVKILRVPLTMTIDDLERAVLETIERNAGAMRADDEHRMMIDVSRGLLGIYRGRIDAPPGPNVIIADFPLRWTVAGMAELYERGVNGIIPSQRAIPASLLDPKVKNRSRVHYLMANIQVGNHAGADNRAILLDPDGFVAESTGDNVLIVRKGRIVSPEGRNILRGISRAYVMEELAPRLGIPVDERNLTPYDVHTACEAFLVATPYCILPMVSLDAVPIGDGRPGPVYRRLLAAWSEEVGIDIAGQIRAWDAAPAPGGGDGPTAYRFR